MQFSTRNRRLLIVLTVLTTALLPCVSLSSRRLMAADRFAGLGALAGDRSSAIAPRGSGNLESNRPQMREGTLIPPTSGRIVLVGRRWAFVPDGTAAKVATEDSQRNSLTTPTTSFPAQAFSDRSERVGENQADPYAAPVPNFGVAVTTSGGPGGAKTNQTKGQMLITENVMLQRVVEAIRIDAADDHWTISGEVTEFFDQNRLIIRTAQRANSD